MELVPIIAAAIGGLATVIGAFLGLLGVLRAKRVEIERDEARRESEERATNIDAWKTLVGSLQADNMRLRELLRRKDSEDFS